MGNPHLSGKNGRRFQPARSTGATIIPLLILHHIPGRETTFRLSNGFVCDRGHPFFTFLFFPQGIQFLSMIFDRKPA
jgi:hypothetical protein